MIEIEVREASSTRQVIDNLAPTKGNKKGKRALTPNKKDTKDKRVQAPGTTTSSA